MLRLGCFGCLGGLVVAVLLAGSAWAFFQATGTPALATVQTSPADGHRAQQKIFEVMRRARSGRSHTVEMSEREVNGFLARHLTEGADLPLRRLAVQLHGDGQAEIVGQLPWRDVLAVPPLSLLKRVIPASSLERGAWLTVLGRPTVERSDRPRERRFFRLDVDGFWLGHLRLPEIMVRVLLDPAALRLLRTPLPDGVDGIKVEAGRVLIETSP